MVTLYGIKNCDSVRKALKFLTSHNIAYTFIDFREHPATLQQIDKWLQQSELKQLFNTRSTTYRTLQLKEKGLSDEEKRLWLARENLLIKRPVLAFGNHLVVGYNELQYRNVLLNKE